MSMPLAFLAFGHVRERGAQELKASAQNRILGHMKSSSNHRRQLVFCVVMIGGIVLFDQLVKLWAVRVLSQASGGMLPLIPGFMGLRYMENTGAAFSMFSEHTWLLGVLSTALAAIIIWLLYRYRDNPSWLLRVALCFIAGGAIGNVIDRFGRGYVVDMLDFEFMDFAIFNVADSFVCVGAVMFCIYVIFCMRPDDKEGDEPGKDAHGD